MLRRAVRRRASWLLAAPLFLLPIACEEATPPAQGGEASVGIAAVLTPEQQAQIAGMSVEVTGPGIGTPIVATLDVAGAAVNGTVRVPVGSARTFTVRAFDVQGVETHAGSATLDVRPGDNPPLVVQLAGRSGTVPIDVSIGSYAIAVMPGTVTLARGATATLTATVSEIGGGAVVNPALQWGARNPVVARLAPGANGTATLTGGVVGTTLVVASWRGLAAAVQVTVTP